MSSEMDLVVVRDLTKTYRIGVGRARVREMLPPPLDRMVRRVLPGWWARDTFNALEDISFRIRKGSSVGVVGHNGAGKTTLLKVIAGVTSPTSGTVELKARAAALIDAIVGFHPELTGRENIILLGTVHGFGRRAIESRLDEVLRFAEIEDFADTPLKRYSTGMISRLGFATITALDVDVLLVDEVLAVGDAPFQHKCMRWLDAYRSNGGTLLIVSHNLALIRSMAERVVWIDHGRVSVDAPTDEGLALYARAIERRDPTTRGRRATKEDVHKAMAERGLLRWGAGGARVEEVKFDEPAGDGRALDVSVRFSSEGSRVAVFTIGFIDETGREIASATSPPVPMRSGEGTVRCAIRPLPLRPGIYFPMIQIASPDGVVSDQWRLDRAVVVEQDGSDLVGAFGPVEIGADWSARAEESGPAKAEREP
jgi:ABC-type polysaccharide/polyol phosphate transport system ATPase subunit